MVGGIVPYFVNRVEDVPYIGSRVEGVPYFDRRLRIYLKMVTWWVRYSASNVFYNHFESTGFRLCLYI